MQSKTKYDPAIYMWKETAENGVLLKEYCCVHASQVNYGKPSDCGRRGGLMVSALDSGASGPGSSPGRGHCVVFLGKTLYSHDASLHPGV